MDLSNAIKIAKDVRKNVYSPYGKYYVGAALMAKSGKIYSGCNIENHGIMSVCAERVAFLKAISEGEHDFEYIVVCGGPDIGILEECLPCGYCRQFMSEFVSSDFKIYGLLSDDTVSTYSISDLLPHSFSLMK